MNDEKINAIRDRSDRLSDDNAKLAKENYLLQRDKDDFYEIRDELIGRLFEAYWIIHKPELKEKALRLWAFKSLSIPALDFVLNKFYLSEEAFTAPIKELEN